MSPEMEEYIKNCFELVRGDMEKRMLDLQSTAMTITSHFVVDGVIDSAVWDVKEKKFTKLRVKMATGKISAPLFSKGKTSVLSDGFKIEEIDL